MGVDLRAVARAVRQNVKAGHVESGASTISMQVIRLSQDNPPRTIGTKIKEMILATRLELRYSKEEILRMWATHAPMGGNVIGLDAASWRYFAKSPQHLSIAESAMLAVLPNAPSLIHPGRNRDQLRAKRDRLLLRMMQQGLIDSLNYDLALLEDVPEQPSDLPSWAPHFLQYAKHTAGDGKARYRSTLSRYIQQDLVEIAHHHHQINQASGIENLAILVADAKTGEVLSYVGNAPHATSEAQVDMVQSVRSSGSVLKPLLYAGMIDQELMMPHQLVLDVPTHFADFNPMNYNKTFSGAVPADVALSKSLNIPAVRMLQEYGVGRMIEDLRSLGFSDIDQSADHYGLSLILGGAEVSLWQLAEAYAKMAFSLRYFCDSMSQYPSMDGSFLHAASSEGLSLSSSMKPQQYSAGATWHMLQAMKKLERPNSEGLWDQFDHQRPISWKTGTSYGHRDAWAIGLNGKYVIGVWVGNADGEGRHGLVGVKKAGPVLFDIINQLDGHEMFPRPEDDLVELKVCSVSGHLASEACTHVSSSLIASSSIRSTCPYHHGCYVNADQELVLRDCHDGDLKESSYFELPALAEYYYKILHPEYHGAPDVAQSCEALIQSDAMSLIYPRNYTEVYLPTNHLGEREAAVLKAVHSEASAKIYWHLNEEFVGVTEDIHHMEISPSPGKHLVTLMDGEGRKLQQQISILH